MVRKVKLTRSEVEMSKSMGIPLEDVAKAKLPKRGRPKGSKNKPKMARFEYQPYTVSNKTFEEEIAEWDRMENEVDFKDLCQKLQEALAKSYCDYEELEKNVAFLRDEIVYRDVIIRYLESRRA